MDEGKELVGKLCLFWDETSDDSCFVERVCTAYYPELRCPYRNEDDDVYTHAEAVNSLAVSDLPTHETILTQWWLFPDAWGNNAWYKVTTYDPINETYLIGTRFRNIDEFIGKKHQEFPPK